MEPQQVARAASGIADQFLAQGVLGAVALFSLGCVVYLFRLYVRTIAEHAAELKEQAARHAQEMAILVERHILKAEKSQDTISELSSRTVGAIEALAKRGRG